jgi:hypothetical protein
MHERLQVTGCTAGTQADIWCPIHNLRRDVSGSAWIGSALYSTVHVLHCIKAARGNEESRALIDTVVQRSLYGTILYCTVLSSTNFFAFEWHGDTVRHYTTCAVQFKYSNAGVQFSHWCSAHTVFYS